MPYPSSGPTKGHVFEGTGEALALGKSRDILSSEIGRMMWEWKCMQIMENCIQSENILDDLMVLIMNQKTKETAENEYGLTVVNI